MGHPKEAGESILCLVGWIIRMSESVQMWVFSKSSFYLSICHSSESLCRFHATMSCYIWRQWQHKLRDHWPQQCIMPYYDATIERVGEIRMENWVIERWLGLHCQCKHSFPSIHCASNVCLACSSYQSMKSHKQLKTTSHVLDAVACFYQLCGEVEQEADHKQANWTRSEQSCACEHRRRCTLSLWLFSVGF